MPSISVPRLDCDFDYVSEAGRKWQLSGFLMGRNSPTSGPSSVSTVLTEG